MSYLFLRRSAHTLSDTNDGLGTAFAQVFSAEASTLGIQILAAQSFQSGVGMITQDMREAMQLIKDSGALIIVFVASIYDTVSWFRISALN